MIAQIHTQRNDKKKKKIAAVFTVLNNLFVSALYHVI